MPVGRAGGPTTTTSTTKDFKNRIPLGSSFFKKVNPKYVLIIIALVWASAYGVEWYRDQVVGQSIRVDVETIVDGDTFVATIPSITYFHYPVRARFRLRAIDAPEHDQPYAVQATTELHDLIHPKNGLSSDTEVICRVWGKDPWGRYVADVVIRQGLYSRVLNVQKELVRRGAAWSFPRFQQSKDRSEEASLDELMNDARVAKRGLWGIQSDPEAPWLHRQRIRQQKGGPSSIPSRSRYGENPRAPTDSELEQAKHRAQTDGTGRNPFNPNRPRASSPRRA
jgi:endonuclease YncB( thermonuclease family)